MQTIERLSGSDTAKAILPVLQRHAARHVEEASGDHRFTDLAARLRTGMAGGDALAYLDQNSEEFPDALDGFRHVLCAFEECALGGYLSPSGVQVPREKAGEPRPWMLHAAAGAIRAETDLGDKEAAKLLDIADRFLEVPIPPYRRLV